MARGVMWFAAGKCDSGGDGGDENVCERCDVLWAIVDGRVGVYMVCMDVVCVI